MKISNDSTTSNNLETAEVLNSFFQSTFNLKNSDKVPSFPSRSDVCLTDITGTEEMVFETLFKLKPFKAPGPNGIHPYTLKECSSSLCRPLCMLFNQSLQFG